ncbi:MAG: STAS domain-containing protein [Alphaproteobacteria bacterium]
MTTTPIRLDELLRRRFDSVLGKWIAAQSAEGVLRRDLMRESEIRQQSRALLDALALTVGRVDLTQRVDLDAEEWAEVKQLLKDATDRRVERGFTPSEMATFVLSLKQPLFEALTDELADSPTDLLKEAWAISRILDQLGLYTNEVYIAEREEIIQRQQTEMMELSTPVVQLWDRILALPLIGTLDSVRAQMVMENLLQAIVDRGAEFAIVDITGVPTVDTLVAQHLLKTAAAVRLMGAHCIISGIRPQIAQTIVHLGVDLPQVVTKSDIQSALAHALRQMQSQNHQGSLFAETGRHRG